MAFVRKIGFLRGSTRDICLSDSNLPAASLTTDTDFTQTIGRKADAATTAISSSTTSNNNSAIALLKYVANLLNGTRIRVGQPIVLYKGTTLTPAVTSGIDITGVSSGGPLLLEEIAVQKITNAESVEITRLVLVSNDDAPLNLILRKKDGNLIAKADLVVGARFSERVNWQLASGKKLTVKAYNAADAVVAGTAGYLWTLKFVALTEAATIATA